MWIGPRRLGWWHPKDLEQKQSEELRKSWLHRGMLLGWGVANLSPNPFSSQRPLHLPQGIAFSEGRAGRRCAILHLEHLRSLAWVRGLSKSVSWKRRLVCLVNFKPLEIRPPFYCGSSCSLWGATPTQTSPRSALARATCPQPSSSASWPTEGRFSSAHWLSELLTLFGQ